MARTQVTGGGIRVHGLTDLRRELANISEQLPGELADVNKDVADYVVDRATGRAEALGAMQARAARSLSAARQLRVALVRLGGARHPEALGAEFGAIRNVPRDTPRGPMLGWNQFEPWRGSNITAGYFLFPTIREDTPQILDLYLELLDRLFRRAFPD